MAIRILLADIAVSPYSHVFVVIVLQLGVEFMLCRHVVGFQLNMVMIAHDGEGAFEKRADAVPGYDNPSPPNMGRNAIIINDIGSALKDLVILSSHLFGMSYVAILVEKFDV